MRIALDSKLAGVQNEKLILGLLRDQGPLSQSEICRRAALNSSTVSYIVGRLREKGLVCEEVGRSKKRGARPVMLSVNPAGLHVMGVEIDPNRLHLAVYDFNCRSIDRISVALENERLPEQITNTIEINLRGLIAKNQIKPDSLIGLGVTLSGSVSADGMVELSSPMGWRGVNLKALLQERIECPVHVYTTRVRLLAEMNAIEKQQTQNLLYFNVGNGVGASSIIDGHLMHGATNRLGEVGHMIVVPDGPVCGCGHQGCLEAVTSGPALARKIRRDLEQGRKSILSEGVTSNLLPEEVVTFWGQAIQAEDAYALDLADDVCGYISHAVAITVNLYDPDVIVLAGYVAEQCMDQLVATIKTRIDTDVYDPNSRNILIRPAAVKTDALVYGAALACLQKEFGIA